MTADQSFVSRGGLKLQHALNTFGLDVTGLVCADLGASTGGFTDCLLQAGAARVYSVDTAYGIFAWKLRIDDRVVVIERSNALHVQIPPEVSERGGVDLVVIDLGWTRQAHALPAAERWLRRGGHVVSLLKPHYEQDRPQDRHAPRQGVLEDHQAEAVARRVQHEIQLDGWRVRGMTRSPIRGGKGTGNLEWLIWLDRA